MKVKELIEILKGYDENHLIVIAGNNNNFYDINEASIEQVKENVNNNVSYGDYYITSWEDDENPDKQVLALNI